jgi:uncharacterized membrane-anchored protein YitT (DUF2179 family)
MKNTIIRTLLIIAGMLTASLGISGFLVPNRFIDGGVTGLSMLLANLSGLPLPWLVVLINVPFIIIGYRQVGRLFFFRSTLAIFGFALCLMILPIPVVTHDKLLASVFGGFCLGGGIGLAIRGGAVLDGTEILALILSKRFIGTVGDMILLFNVALFSIAAIYFGVEPAMYSVLTYLAAFVMVDYVLYGIDSYNGVTIISTRYEEIKNDILKNLGRGVTVYRGYGGMSEKEQDILYCVVMRLEVPRIRSIIQKHDSNAVVFIHHISDAGGGVLKKRAFH